MTAKRIARPCAGLAALVLTLSACSTMNGTSTPATAGPAATHAADGAQGGASTPAAPAAGATNGAPVSGLNSWIMSRNAPTGGTEDLPLGPGDLLSVSVFLVSELSQLSVRVPSTGNVALPLVGVIPVTGRTARQVEEEIKARLQEKYMHDPQVSVFVQEHRSQQVAVFGAVKNGGVYPLVSRLRVTDALAMAGALNDDADHVVYLIRRTPPPPGAGQPDQINAASTATPPDDEKMIPIDLELVTRDRQDLNLVLQAGDVIHVPRAGAYYVGGEVNKAGSFLLRAKTTLHQAIVNAGGVKNTADWDDVRVYRPQANGNSEVLKYSLNQIEDRPDKEAVEIKKNDVVIVGLSNMKAFGYGVLNFIRFGIGASVPF